MEMPVQTPGFKRSLILAGGGVRLAYHAGVLVALEEAGKTFDHIDGTSGGIFGTAMLASGITPKDAAVRWRKLNLDGFMEAIPVKKYFNLTELPALGSAGGIRKKIFPALGIDVKKINANTRFKATFNVCNFTNKTIESITNEDVNEDYLIAGMSLPIFMPGVKINDDWYTDAVWIKDANMIGAVNGGAEELWLVWCIGNTKRYLEGSFNQYVHMIEISANGGLYAEIEWLRNNNIDRINKALKPIELHVIKPEYPLPLDPDFLFNKINADTLIDMGYADAKQHLANDKIFGDNEPVFKATAMTTLTASLHFRQQFTGKIIIDNSLCPVIIQLSFFIREMDNEYVLQQFSSISINQTDFISGYNNRIKVNAGAAIDSAFQFYFKGINYTANLKMHLHNVSDLIIGIDNKMALVSIGPDQEPQNESMFIQPAINRIKNAFYLNVTTQANWYGRLKTKRRLLSKLFI